ncbi:MAG: hypothetical protein M5R38_07275 [Candidatus Methylomirabilis sp.]|nr:hypothetical protein [Candidatus Methylomirabilis sp.]
MTVRHYNRADETRVERATLADVFSLSPIDAVTHAPSWKINVGMQTIRHHGCRLCRNGVLGGGIGAAVESRLLGREVLFAFAEAEGNYSRAYDKRHRIGGGGTVGIVADLTPSWRAMATGTYLGYAVGERSDDIRWSIGSRYTLSRNWTLRIEYHHRDRDDDAAFALQAFFFSCASGSCHSHSMSGRVHTRTAVSGGESPTFACQHSILTHNRIERWFTCDFTVSNLPLFHLDFFSCR